MVGAVPVSMDRSTPLDPGGISAVSAVICGVSLFFTWPRHCRYGARGCCGQRSRDIAVTVSASGPRVGLTWIRSRSSAVKWIRQTMTLRVAHHGGIGQCSGLPAGARGNAETGDRREERMTRKVLWLLPASLAAVLASQWKDIARYLKIHQMSRGVPARTGTSGSADTPSPAGTPTPPAPRLLAPREMKPGTHHLERDETGLSPRRGVPDAGQRNSAL